MTVSATDNDRAKDNGPRSFFLSKTRVLHGSVDNHLRPLPIGVAGSSGTMSVHADILPQYIEKVVVFVPTILGSMGDEVVLKGGEVLPGSGFSHARARRREDAVCSG